MQRNFTKGCVQRCLMAVPLLLLLSFSYAQKSAQPGRNVTLNNSNISLREVFNIIEKQTGVVLFFMDINTSQHVGIHVANSPVEDVLAEVLNPLGLTYEYVKGNRDKIFIKSVGGTRVVKKDTAQVVVVSGVVMDDKGQPLPGATVRIKGTSFGTATNPNGSFTLSQAGAEDVIQVSYTGFITEEIALKGRANVSIKLKQGDNSLNEAVVVAYGTVEQRAVTGSITVVKGAEVQTLPNRSFDRSLQGLVPGLLITSGNGQPGGGISNFVLRGISTGTDAFQGSTVRNPLIVIDGIPVNQEYFQPKLASFTATPITNPLSQINPSDIETISVLKDAVAISLYGSKASNGVILVTTKKGKAGKTIFNFRHQVDLSSRVRNKIDFLSQKEYLDLIYESYRNFDPSMRDSDIDLDLKAKFPIENNNFYVSPNWNKELYRNNAATLTNELSMTGGNEKSTFYANVEYTDQKGILLNTGYKRASYRLNFENRANNWLKFGMNNTISYNVENYSSNTIEGASSYGIASLLSPLNPIRYSDRSYVFNYRYGILNSSSRPAPNPLAEAELNINRVTVYRGLTKLYSEVNLLKYFRFIPSIGIDFMLSETKEKIDPKFYIGRTLPGVGQLRDYSLRRANAITTNILRFEDVIERSHSINLLIGQEAQIITQKDINLDAQGFSNSYFEQINNATSPINVSAGTYKETLMSLFGQANYSYKDKYFLSTSIRRDGSSKFGNNRRFGIYWSLGSGWIVSEESFWPTIPINYLKIRTSIGQAGNSAAINRNTRYDVLGSSFYSDKYAVAPFSATPGNPDVQWEKTFTADVGIELRMLRDRINLTADIYRRMTSNLLYTVNMAPTTGYLSVLDNIGSMRNQGLEIFISADLVRNEFFRWNTKLNWSTNNNVLIKANMPLAASVAGELVNKEGENFNSFYLVKWAGVNTNDGSPQWIDSLGKIGNSYNAAKKEIVGKPQPDAFGGLNNSLTYKNLELSIFLTYKYGFKVYDQASIYALNDGGSYPYLNQTKSALHRWQKPGDIAENPKRILNNPNSGSRASTRYLFDGDYVRLDMISLSYLLKQKKLQMIGINRLQVYLQANNLAMWTKYPNQDPDLVNVAGSIVVPYPKQRTYTFGLNVSF